MTSQTSTTENPAASGPSHSKVERTLVALSHASQIGLLALAVFGYFYTVLPFYQKALLDEEIAKKTLELSARSAELVAKEKELAAMNEAVAEANAAARKAESDVVISRSQMGKLKGDLEGQYRALRTKVISDFVNRHVLLCVNTVPGDVVSCVSTIASTVDHLRVNDQALLFKLLKAEGPRLAEAYREVESVAAAKREDMKKARAAFKASCEATDSAGKPRSEDAKKLYVSLCEWDARARPEFDVRVVDQYEHNTKKDSLMKALLPISRAFHSKE